jgi:tripartite-type tricarboxylate transporter receptor subunit TctC
MVALGLTLQVTAGAAQSVSDTFRGKTLRILLPTLPGGGRSLYALPFAQFFGKHIPGNPTILPVFMPGAGGSIAVNNAYGVAAPDGLTIVSPLASVITAQAVGDESVKYDASRFNWIGRITDGTRQVAKVQFNPMTGEELARSVARTLAAPRSVIDRYKSAVTED